MSMISKQLTKSDIEKSLLMPTDSLVPFRVTAVDGTGKTWDFPCIVEQSEGIVSVGWLRFLSGKDVRAGDTVFLLRKPVDDGGGDLTASAKLKIEVKRKIRLMGEDIWAVLQ
ncbi:hypothetical protein ES288_A03G233300v1 [Gossypium darwinii]|uniref:TF-B3 domain-containing protein n=1 Tax=Gossypium darwinii TaxID=34276 RepID=A0A5D2H8H8_GOSDA|nr:hypothetical protein ES288_A03G233300v1 [Gossypium darwinii]